MNKLSDSMMATAKGDSVGVYTITVPNIYVRDVDEREPSELPGSPPGTSTTHLHQKDPDGNGRMAFPRLTLNFALNFVIFVFLGVVCVLCEYGYIPHTKVGFHCGDSAISFPFEGDTCSMLILLLFIVLLPAITFWSLEAVLYQPDEYTMKKSRLEMSARISLVWYIQYALGAIVNLTLVEVGKVVLGEHRPHFLASCTPDTAINCTIGEYVKDFTCTNNNKFSLWQVSDASKSFPSGHTSLSVHLGFFMFFYFQKRMRFFGKREPVLMTILLQCSFLTISIFASLTRITDNRHNWWDVLAGFCIGIATSFYAVKILANSFSLNEPSLSRDSISNSDISGDRAAAHPSVRRLLSTPSYVKDVS